MRLLKTRAKKNYFLITNHDNLLLLGPEKVLQNFFFINYLINFCDLFVSKVTVKVSPQIKKEKFYRNRPSTTFRLIRWMVTPLIGVCPPRPQWPVLRHEMKADAKNLQKLFCLEREINKTKLLSTRLKVRLEKVILFFQLF